VPVQAKCLADPSMHAISSAATSPSGKWWLGQSADNRIVTYSASESVRHNKKKTFGGHSSAGYACQIGVSHDGQYVYSGDGEGKVFIWSWKTKEDQREPSLMYKLTLTRISSSVIRSK
jgi:pre-mRNA-processing factor 17